MKEGSTAMKVPFLDLKAQYRSIKGEVAAAMQEVLDACAFAGGPFVEKFEKEWAAFCGTKHAIACGNGTDALWLALVAMGVGRGDEVITVPNTFIATAEAISLTGARPVFVDVDEATFTMDPARLEAAITARTRAIIPVDLCGQVVDMDPILAIAKSRKIPVVEDACQAHGATYRLRRAGSLTEAGAFSFYPGKNLGAYGEGGAVTTSDDALAARMRMFRDHGQSKKYYHDIVGWNARLDGIQGAVLGVKLKHLDAWNEARRRHAAQYDKLLAKVPGVTAPAVNPAGRPVYHLYMVRVKNRPEVQKRLEASGVSTGIHYPVPVHLQKAYADMGLGKGSFPVAERSAEEVLSLPMYAELTPDMVQYVVDRLREAVS